MSEYEERIEYGSGLVFEAAAPHANHKTGDVDKAKAWPRLEAAVCRLRELGFPMREISRSYADGLGTVRDMIELQREMAIREQFSDK